MALGELLARIERLEDVGDLFRALGRYNGSLGQPHYPNLVRAAWERHWSWQRPTLAASEDGRRPN